MSARETIAEMGYEESVVFETPDFDEAIIGVTSDGNVVYDYEKMVDSLMKKDGMTREEAVEFIDYNTIRALPYAEDPAPVIMYKLWE